MGLTFEKLENGNVTITGYDTGLRKSYDSGKSIIQQGNKIILLYDFGETAESFTAEQVDNVIRDDGTNVPISDIDTLFNELATYFFFSVDSGGGGGGSSVIQGKIAVTNSADWVDIGGGEFAYDFQHNLGTQDLFYETRDTDTNKVVILKEYDTQGNDNSVRLITNDNTINVRTLIGIGVASQNGGEGLSKIFIDVGQPMMSLGSPLKKIGNSAQVIGFDNGTAATNFNRTQILGVNNANTATTVGSQVIVGRDNLQNTTTIGNGGLVIGELIAPNASSIGDFCSLVGPFIQFSSSNPIGAQNQIFGYNFGSGYCSGDTNFIAGWQNFDSGSTETSANTNAIIGFSNFRNVSLSTSNNTVVGSFCAADADADYSNSTLVGLSVGRKGGGSDITGVGRAASFYVKGSFNTSVGARSGSSSDETFNPNNPSTAFEGERATFVGYQSGYEATAANIDDVVVVGEHKASESNTTYIAGKEKGKLIADQLVQGAWASVVNEATHSVSYFLSGSDISIKIVIKDTTQSSIGPVTVLDDSLGSRFIFKNLVTTSTSIGGGTLPVDAIDFNQLTSTSSGDTYDLSSLTTLGSYSAQEIPWSSGYSPVAAVDAVDLSTDIIFLYSNSQGATTSGTVKEMVISGKVIG